MKSKLVHLLFVFLALVLGAALEDMLPSFGGVKFPVLLGLAAAAAASDDQAPVWVMTAVAAGAFEDALAGQPALTAVVFFTAVALGVRLTRLPQAWTVVAYPAYQLWAGLLVTGSGGGVFGRFLVAFPVGALTLAVVFGAFPYLRRKAGADA